MCAELKGGKHKTQGCVAYELEIALIQFSHLSRRINANTVNFQQKHLLLLLYPESVVSVEHMELVK